MSAMTVDEAKARCKLALETINLEWRMIRRLWSVMLPGQECPLDRAAATTKLMEALSQ